MKNKKLLLTGVVLTALTTVVYADTMRDLVSGSALSGSDLFVTRQGADTADKAVTGTQIKDYVQSNTDTDDIAEGVNKYTTASDISKLSGIESNATADQTDTEIKTAYENNADSNAFTDAEQTKLSGIASGAEVNAVDSVNTQTGIVVLDTDDVTEGVLKYYSSGLFVADFALQDSDDLTEGTVNLYNQVPTGGTTGQSLTKIDGTNFNVEWSTVSGGGGNFCDLGDVTCTALGDNDVIKFVSSSQDWANGAIGSLFEGAGTDSILIDVTGGTGTAGQAGATAIGANAIAGDSGDANTINATAIGIDAIAQGRKATAIGNSADASAVNCVAIGDNPTCSGGKSVAIGNDANVTGSATDNFSVGIGSTIDIDNDNAFGVGQAITITHDDTIIFGAGQSSEYVAQFKYGPKYLNLGEIATVSLITCSAAQEGAIVYDVTSNEIKLCNASSVWAAIKTGADNQTPFCVPLSDEGTNLETGTAKFTITIPQGLTLTDVQASVVTAPTGSVVTVDINEAGTSILSTKLTIDAAEKDSSTAATAVVISDSALAVNSLITFDIDTIGSTIAGTGLKVCLSGLWD